jgi:inward rectifier potassium channel
MSGWAAVHLRVALTMCPHTGIIMSAAVLGILINRASMPQARVVFSDNCLFTSRNGEPSLVLRIGNTRGNFLLNPEIRIGFLQVCLRV